MIYEYLNKYMCTVPGNKKYTGTRVPVNQEKIQKNVTMFYVLLHMCAPVTSTGYRTAVPVKLYIYQVPGIPGTCN